MQQKIESAVWFIGLALVLSSYLPVATSFALWLCLAGIVVEALLARHLVIDAAKNGGVKGLFEKLAPSVLPVAVMLFGIYSQLGRIASFGNSH
ncbi:hypothetical protein [Aquitalea palustris]|uniref:hypothetical protein n=1 Tax=Aquitalea palustris TaxID=2480983 RepID=UPI001CEFFB0F|nr:hypothetical protein [Aquitalea palustris]